MHAGLRSALFGSALPLAGFELGMDFRAGWYRSGAIVTRDPAALPGYSFTRGAQRYEFVNGAFVPIAAGSPGIVAGAGYLARPPQTNLLPNSMMIGADLGLAYPTSWSGHPAWQIIGKGTSLGLPYIDLAFSLDNTAGSSTVQAALHFITSTVNPAAGVQGDTFTLSALIQLLSGVAPGAAGLYIHEYDSSNNLLSNGARSLASAGSVGGPPAIVANQRTLLSAGTAKVSARLQYSVPAGENTSFTVRMWAPQLIKGLSPLPLYFIPTTGGVATVPADDMSLSQPIPADENWVIISASNVSRTAAQQIGNHRFWRARQGGKERLGVYRNIPVAGGAQGRMSGIVTAPDDSTVRPPGGDIPLAGRIVSVLRKTGTSYQLATRGPDGAVAFGAAQALAQYPSPIIDFLIAGDVDGYHEFFGWRRGTFGDEQVRGMLAAFS